MWLMMAFDRMRVVPPVVLAPVADLTSLLDDPERAGWPDRMRVLVRRERPPGVKLTLLEAHDGWRYQGVATDTQVGHLAWVEARHRAHARVEDRITNLKQTGIGPVPIPRVRHQPDLAAAGAVRCGPDRLDPDHTL